MMDRYRGRLPFPVAGPGVPVLPPLPVGNFANVRRGPQPSMEDLNIVNAMIQAAQQRQAQQPTPPGGPVIDPNQAVAEMVGAGAFAQPTTPVDPNFVYTPNPQRSTVNSALNDYFSGIMGQANKTLTEASFDNLSGTLGNVIRTGGEAIPAPARPFVHKVFSGPQEWNIRNIGDLAYEGAQGKKDRWLDWRQYNPTQYADAEWTQWAEDDANKQTIIDAHENGYDTDGDGQADVTGGEAVYLAFLSSLPEDHGFWTGDASIMSTLIRGAVLDPYTYAALLGGVGGVLTKSGKASVIAKGGVASKGDTAKILAGRLLKAPDEIIENTVDLPFNIAGQAIGKAVGRFGPVRRALAPSDQTMRADAEAQVDDLYDIAARITPDGGAPPPAAAAPHPTGPTAPTAPGTQPSAGTVTEFTVVQMGPKDFRIIDPATGKPIRTATGEVSFETHRIAQADATRRNADALPKITEPTTGAPTEGIITRPGETLDATTAAPARQEPIISRPDEAPVTPTGILRTHWMNPETGRKVPYDGTRLPSVPEFVTYEMGQADPAMARAWWKAVEEDPRTVSFIEEQAAFDRAPSPYGNAPGPQRDSAEKILSQARNEVEVQRAHFTDLTDGIAPDHVFRHGDQLHPIIANRVNGGRAGTSYPDLDPGAKGDIERNAVERAIFGSDEEAAAARQYFQIMKKASTSTPAEKLRASNLLDEIVEIRAQRVAQDGSGTLDTADAGLPGMPKTDAPTFGARPSNLLDVPPQTTAPTLDLQTQVLDTPAAQRQAETLAGQTDMFGAQTAAKSLPSLEDAKYRRPMSHFTDTIYREIDADELGVYLPGAVDQGLQDMFVSNTPELAMGQGINVGATLEFGSGDIEGQLSRRKPTWQWSYNQGQAEFVVRDATTKQIADNLQSVTIAADALDNLPTEGRRKVLRARMNDLRQSGWSETTHPDGSVTFTRPTSQHSPVSQSQATMSPPSDLDPNFRRVTTDRIQTDTGAYQMREADYARPTVDNIKATWDAKTGIREPITVTSNPDGSFTVLSGHSRLQAVRELIDEGRAPADTTIPVQVRTGTPDELAREALTSNDRTALGPAEEGHKIKRLIDAGEKPEVARGTLSKAEAERRVALTYLSPEMQALVNQDPTLVAKFAPMGQLIEEGVSDAAEMAQYWYKQALPNRLDATSIAEELRIVRQMKGPQVQQFGLFAGMDLWSSAASDAFAKVRTLRRQRAALNAEKRAFTGVNKSTRASATTKAEAQQVIDDLQREVADLEAELGIAPKARRKPRGAPGIVPDEVSYFWDLQARVGNAARGSIPDLPEGIAGVADESSLGQAFNKGEIDQEQYDALNRTITVGGEPLTVFDLIQRKLADFPGDRASGMRSLRADIARADGLDQKTRGWLLRALDTTSSTLRENIMYNPGNMVRGAMADQMGDMLAMTVTGNAGAAASSLNLKNVYRWWRRRNSEAGMLADDPRVLELNDYGEALPRELMVDVSRGETAMQGEMNVTRGARKLEQKVAGENAPRLLSRVTPLIANKTARDIRTAFDRNRRISQFLHAFRREMPEARATLEGYARKTHGEDMGNLIQTMPERFTPADVLEVTGSEDLARQWRRLTSNAKKTANAEVNRVLFSYKANNIDSKMKHAVFFHYWMSRSLLLHSRATLQNPALLNVYLNGLDLLKAKAEEEGLPLNVRTYYKFMGDIGGWYSLVDPIGAVLPYSIFRDMGDERSYGSKFDKIVQRSGLFLSPVVQAAATALGWSETVPNLTGTTAMQGYAKTAIDYARNHGLDFGAWGPGISTDPIEGATRKLFEVASELSADSGLIPFAKKLPFFDKEANEQTQVLDVLLVQMEGEYGPFLGWDEAQRQEFLAAQVAIQTGAQTNERANAALAEWSEGKAVGKAVGLVTPGGVWTKYGPRDTRSRLNREAGEARDAGIPLTPEQENADAATQQINAADPLAAEARTDQDMYGTVGGSRGQQIVQNWNLLAHGSLEDLEASNPGGYVRLANGKALSYADFVARTDDEREAAADAYLDRNNYRGSYERVRDKQGAFKDAHPVYKGYSEWRGLVGKLYDDDVKAFREAMMAASPAYRTYIGRLRPDVKNDPKRFDQESTSMAAYLAMKGSKDSVYAEGLPQNNEAWANTEILLRAIDGGSGKARAKYDLDSPEGKLASLKDKLSTYDQEMSVYNQAVLKETNGVAFEALPPEFQKVTQGILERQGIKRPSTPEVVSAYNMWRMAQPDPSQATPEAYVAWLTTFETGKSGTKPSGRSISRPTADPRFAAR